MESPRSVSLVVAKLGFVALAVLCTWKIIESSGNPRKYHQFRNNEAGFVYPTDSVIAWSAAIVLELLGVFVFLGHARRTPPGVRLLTILFASVLEIAALALGAMHAPPYYGWHLIWLVFAGAWSFVTAIAAVIEHGTQTRNQSV